MVFYRRYEEERIKNVGSVRSIDFEPFPFVNVFRGPQTKVLELQKLKFHHFLHQMCDILGSYTTALDIRVKGTSVGISYFVSLQYLHEIVTFKKKKIYMLDKENRTLIKI